jgi:surface carbohydrate biosynthesis protein
MRIALVVDHPQRDLLGLALVAQRLCREGAVCFLVPRNMEVTELAGLAPDVTLITYLRRTNEGRVRRLLEAGLRLVLHDTEGGALASLDAYGASLAPDPSVRRSLAGVCAWGPALAAHAVDAGWFDADQVTVTGAPRFDLYREPWRGALSVSGGGDPGVLVVSTFTLANPRFLAVEEEVQLQLAVGRSPEAVGQRLEGERKAMRGLADLARRLSVRFPDVPFVFRPHPFEKVETYRPWLEGPSNLTLDGGGPLGERLLGARAVVHRGSTAAVEAAAAGVPVLEAGWLPHWAEVDAVAAAGSRYASTSELEARLVDLLTGAVRSTPGPHPDALTRWFGPLDGLAHERVADVLLRAARRVSTARPARCRALLYGWTGTGGFARKAANLARGALGLPPTWSFRRRAALEPVGWDASDKAFGASQVTDILERLHGCGGAAVNVRPAASCRAYLVPHPGGRSLVCEAAGGAG